MSTADIQKLFKHPFLSQFILALKLLPFTDNEITKLNSELDRYEQLFLNPDIEKKLITKNELLTSFAISKAEGSQLTLQEAQDVYDIVIKNKDYDFIKIKLQNKQSLTQKDCEKLEFFNIAKTFRMLNLHPLSINDLTPALIKNIHKQLTEGLDVFINLPGFNIYKAGLWRDNDTIRVGEYIPAPYRTIEKGVTELIDYIKKNKTVTALAVFHTALYGLHPFNNGNKRVCRILEHLLLRGLKLNSKNLYSTSYYYHKQKPRYYKYLLNSLERKNLNHFVSFILEAIVLSIISVVKTGLKVKRSEFINSQSIAREIKSILKPLIKRKELQYKYLFKIVMTPRPKGRGFFKVESETPYRKPQEAIHPPMIHRGLSGTGVRTKMARQTFVTYLQKATDEKIITKRISGRTTFYSLKLTTHEEVTLHKWIKFAQKRLSYIPDDIKFT